MSGGPRLSGRSSGFAWGLLLTLLLALLVHLALIGTAGAQPQPILAKQMEAPLLVVTGPAADGPQVTVSLDHAALETLPTHTVETQTPWTEGVARFEGPLAREVLAAAGIVPQPGTEAVAVALNDYQVRIPVEDFLTYDVVLALRQDGRLLSRRDKGPIWIVYPNDRHPELDNVEYYARWVWQLTALHIDLPDR